MQGGPHGYSVLEGLVEHSVPTSDGFGSLESVRKSPQRIVGGRDVFDSSGIGGGFNPN